MHWLRFINMNTWIQLKLLKKGKKHKGWFVYHFVIFYVNVYLNLTLDNEHMQSNKNTITCYMKAKHCSLLATFNGVLTPKSFSKCHGNQNDWNFGQCIKL